MPKLEAQLVGLRMSGNKPPLAHMLVWCELGLHRHAHERQLMCKELTLYERSYACMQLWLHQQTNPTGLISVEPNDVISSNQPVSLSVQPETFHCQYCRMEWASDTAVSNISCV
jgi:hypothetical protein